MEQRNRAFADAADTLLVMEVPGGEIESFDILCLQGRTSEEADKLLSRRPNRFWPVACCGRNTASPSTTPTIRTSIAGSTPVESNRKTALKSIFNPIVYANSGL